METILVPWENKFPQETSILCVLSINVIVTIDDPSFETPFSGFHKVNAHSNFDFDITLPYSHVNFYLFWWRTKTKWQFVPVILFNK